MQTEIHIVFIQILFGFFSATSAQLPPEIMADAYLLQVEQSIRDGDLDRGRTVIQKIRSLREQHELDLDVEFYFRYALAAGAVGMFGVALESVVKYLAAVGREGKHYHNALTLMNSVKGESSQGDVSAQLSPDIIADANLFAAEEAIGSGDLDRARTAIQDIRTLQEQHELDLPDTFHFRYAKAANSVDLPEQALESVMNYLAVSGREGQYYVEALELMNRAQVAVSCRGWDTKEYFKIATVDEVTACLDTGIDAQLKDESGVTPLHRAVRYSDKADVITALFNAKVDKEARDNDDRTPLHWATHYDNAVAVRALIEAGADPNVRDKDMQTPLLEAAKKAENPEVIESLLNARADKEARDSDGRAPLHLAAKFNNTVALAALIDAGADLEVQDENEKTPLHCAVEEGHSDAVEILLMAGANRARVKPKWTALHWVVSYNDDPDDIEDLLKAGARLNVGDDAKWRPLHVAAKFSENPEVIRLLITAGADLKAKNKDKWTHLHVAAAYNENPDIAKAFIASGADVQSRAKRKWTPLHAAAAHSDNPEVVRYLIDTGANPNSRADFKGTPLHWAAGYNDNPAVVKSLLNAGVERDARDNDNETPLHWAARYNDNPAVVKALIDAGADPNAMRDDDWTPLHLAANQNENPDVVNALLDGGANPNAKGDDEWTPLHLAAANSESRDVIKILIDAGANLEARTTYNSTPLHWAASKKNLVGLRALIDAGADLQALDNAGDPPLDRVAGWGSNKKPAIKLLRDAGAKRKSEKGTDWGKVAVGALGAAAIVHAGKDAPQEVVDQAIADWARVMAGVEPSADGPTSSATSQSQAAPAGDPMQQALQNMEAVCGENFRSGFAANDHARFYCLAAFGDFCALKQAQNEEARTKLRARLAQNCGVLRNAGVAGKCSYCQ